MAVALHAAGDPQHKGFTSGHIKRDCNSAFYHETSVSIFSSKLHHTTVVCVAELAAVTIVVVAMVVSTILVEVNLRTEL